MTTGEKIKNLITANGIDQAHIAKLLGVSKGAVSQWISGTTEPRLNKLQKIAIHFGLNTSDLIGDDYMSGKKKEIDPHILAANTITTDGKPIILNNTPKDLFKCPENPKKEKLLKDIQETDIPENILDLISAAIAPYKK